MTDMTFLKIFCFKNLILLSSAYIVSAASSVAVSSVCSQYNAGAGGAYWYIFFLSFSLNSLCFLFRDVIKNCTQCASHVNCGLCHFSLLCIEGDERGPLDSTPSEGECPVGLGCMNFSNCFSCAAMILFLFQKYVATLLTIFPLAYFCHFFGSQQGCWKYCRRTRPCFWRRVLQCERSCCIIIYMFD